MKKIYKIGTIAGMQEVTREQYKLSWLASADYGELLRKAMKLPAGKHQEGALKKAQTLRDFGSSNMLLGKIETVTK